MLQDEEIKDFRQLLQELISSEDIETQEELTEVYESLVQDYSHLQKTKYLTRLPVFSKEQLEQTVRRFYEKPIHAKFLQKKNILLSANLWRKIMLAPKKYVGEDYIVETDNDTNIVKLSQLGYLKINGKPRFILRNIEIKLPICKNEEKNLISQLSQNLSNFIATGKLIEIDELEKLVNGCVQFGIHDYLLPEGYQDDESIESAVLLFRYERVFHRANDSNVNTSGHNNYGLPNYYQKVYPVSISQEELTNESHMHFSEGVGAMSKLEDKSEKRNRNNLSAGYALPISKLKEYLIKIQKREFVSEEEKEFYLSNDFGMHFLYLTGDRMKLILKLISAVQAAGKPFDEFKLAIELMNAIQCEITIDKKNTLKREKDKQKNSKMSSIKKKEKEQEDEEEFDLKV